MKRSAPSSAQLDVIVDLAVEAEPIAGSVSHWLTGARREIDDAKPAVTKTDMAAPMLPLTGAVGPTMPLQIVHHPQRRVQLSDRLSCKVQYPGQSTHEPCS